MLLHSQISNEILRCFYRVYKKLGNGFLEKVYENTLVIELQKQGICVQQQAPIEVLYEGSVIGEYFADLLVEKVIIIELKAVETLNEAHSAQLLNYLKATHLEVGLLLNFGPSPEVQRKVMENRMKTSRLLSA